ncbi:MAG: hypothetical protein ABIO71_00230, partial [Caldimonas sp.]
DVATMAQGAWTDLYALACVVYYAITGRAPMSSVERLMDDRLEPLAVAAAGRYSTAFLNAIDLALAVRPQDRPQNERQFRSLLDADLPAVAPALPAAARPSVTTDRAGYSTVPGTLTPVLATQVMQRAPLSPEPRNSPSLPAPWKEPAHAPTSIAGASAEAADVAAANGEKPAARRAALPVQAQAKPLLRVVAMLSLLAALGVAAWLLVPQFETRATPVDIAPPASPIELPTVPAVVVAPPVVIPEAVVPVPLPAALPPEVEAAPALPASAAAPARVRREPVAARPAPVARHEPPAVTRTAAPRGNGARCSDILQKASLEPLTADEAAYLKRECR